MSYFAVALARHEDGWTGQEVDLDELEDLDALAERLRELTGDAPGPAMLVLEEDDEHLAVVRVDGGTAGLDEPRVFLSDRRAVQASGVAAMLWQDADPGQVDDDDEGTPAVAEPVGDTAVLADLGTDPETLLDLCGEEGLLPADVITALCERAGCADALEAVREG